MKPFSQFDTVGFFSNVLAVILGIVITFSIQGIIDRQNRKESVSSALRLVSEELMSCRNDLSGCVDFMVQEKRAASYLHKNLSHLSDCPKDSVAQYGMVYVSQMILTLPDDALELLKTSSLFSAIDDNSLSLAIIRAYDQCNAMRQIFNRMEEQKSEILRRIFIEKGVDKCFYPDGSISISELMNTNYGKFLTTQLLSGATETMMEGIRDIDAAIGMIEDYLEDGDVI